LGQLTSCAGGEAREAPKPNERVYDPETKMYSILYIIGAIVVIIVVLRVLGLV
jgi:uncharacterized membrane protein YkgB